MFKLKKVLAISLALALTATVAGCSNSTGTPEAAKKIEYPTKAVTVLHGFKAGGGSDQLSQLTQPFLEKKLGQKFANVYKPGADGVIALKEMAETVEPDGYTLSTLMVPKIQLHAIIDKDAGYTMDDFVPIANMVYDPGIFIVPADSKFKDFNEVLAYAKENPGKLKVGNSGTGGNGWYNATMIQNITDTAWNNIPFEGDGPATLAAAGGHVEACSTNVAGVTSMVQAGKVKPLAVYADERIEALPDVPTLKELGIDYVSGSYRGYLAPKDTPQEIIDILADALEEVAKDPEYAEAAKTANISVKFMRGQEYTDFLAQEYTNLEKVAKDQNLTK